jgi:hypothetical protein
VLALIFCFPSLPGFKSIHGGNRIAQGAGGIKTYTLKISASVVGIHILEIIVDETEVCPANPAIDEYLHFWFVDKLIPRLKNIVLILNTQL